MAVVHVASVFDAVNTPFQVTLGAGIVAGDLLIAFQMTAGPGADGGSHAAPTGATFSAIGFGPDAQANGSASTRDLLLTCWYRVCDGSEANATISFTYQADAACGVSHFTGARASGMIESADVKLANTSTEVIAPPSVTATLSDSLAVIICVYANDVGYPASLTGGSGTDYSLAGAVAEPAGGDRALAAYTASIGAGATISGKTGTAASATNDAHAERAFVIQRFVVDADLAPDAILVSTNLAGAVTAIDDDPDSPGNDWLTASDVTAATDIRVSFPTPPGDPTVGSGLQKFRALLRKTAGAPTPTIDVELWENGVFVATLLDNISITSTTGQIVEATWNAFLLSGADGANVECRIVSTPGQ